MRMAIVQSANDQTMCRFLADGVPYRVLIDHWAEAIDWMSWLETWSRHADAAKQRAEGALSQGTTAADAEFIRAALYH